MNNAIAIGKHLIIRLPGRKEATQGGIHIPEASKQKFAYGRVVSVGGEVSACGASSIPIHEGDILAYDHRGQRELNLDPVRDEAYTVIHETMVFAVIGEADLTERGLPIPPK